MFRKTIELSLSGIKLFLRGQPKAEVWQTRERGVKGVLEYLSPTLTHGYQWHRCHLFLIIKKLDIVTECQRITLHSIYKFPSETNVFEKRKVMLTGT